MVVVVVEKPHAVVMYCIALRVALKSPSAVYFSVSFIDPHSARALFNFPLFMCLREKTFECKNYI